MIFRARSVTLHYRTKESSEVTRLPANFKKAWLKKPLKDIQSLIKNQTFLIDDSENRHPSTTYINVYKAKVKYDGSLDKLMLRIVERGDLQNK